MRRAGTGAAQIARALLEAGILQEGDWAGSLESSLTRGFRRWLAAQGVRELEEIDVAAIIVEDVREIQLAPRDWLETYAPEVDVVGLDDAALPPVGVFCLQGETFNWVTVAKHVLELEAFCPKLGYLTVGLLQTALERTIGAATPAWAYQDLAEQEEWAEPEDQEDGGFPTVKSLIRTVPEEICLAGWHADDRALLAHGLAVLQERRHRITDLEAVLEAALALADAVAGLERDDGGYLNHLALLLDHSEQDYRPVLPVGVRWTEDDEVARVCDDYHELLAQAGSECYVVFAAGFRPDDPESIAHAACQLGAVAQVVVAADRLLQLLSDRAPVADEAPVTVRERVRV